jgi:hypothetical protein
LPVEGRVEGVLDVVGDAEGDGGHGVLSVGLNAGNII